MTSQSNGAAVCERRVVVRFTDDEIAEGCTSDFDLDRPEFELRIDRPTVNARMAIIPLTSVKRVSIERVSLPPSTSDEELRKVALHCWDGDVLKGLMRELPCRKRYGMTVELISPSLEDAEVLAMPYSAIKAIFFLRTWDTRPPECLRQEGHWTLPRQEAPLIDLLSEIRGLRGLRHRGQISAVEYERRRGQVLRRI